MKSKSKNATLKHIDNVQKKISVVMNELTDRALNHDRSKLEEPELTIFDKYTSKLKKSSFGQKDYLRTLKKMGDGLKHHYDNNRHHPEHHCESIYICPNCHQEYQENVTKCSFCDRSDFYIKNNGIEKMNLVDLVEMFCDWIAATERHSDGDIFKSLDFCRDKYNLSDQLFSILKNTAIETFNKGPEGVENAKNSG